MQEEDGAPVLHVQCEDVWRRRGRTGAIELEVLWQLYIPLVQPLLEDGRLGVAAVRGGRVDGVDRLDDVAQDSC
jgi:hypothetical protein